MCYMSLLVDGEKLHCDVDGSEFDIYFSQAKHLDDFVVNDCYLLKHHMLVSSNESTDFLDVGTSMFNGEDFSFKCINVDAGDIVVFKQTVDGQEFYVTVYLNTLDCIISSYYKGSCVGLFYMEDRKDKSTDLTSAHEFSVEYSTEDGSLFKFTTEKSVIEIPGFIQNIMKAVKQYDLPCFEVVLSKINDFLGSTVNSDNSLNDCCKQEVIKGSDDVDVIFYADASGGEVIVITIYSSFRIEYRVFNIVDGTFKLFTAYYAGD